MMIFLNVRLENEKGLFSCIIATTHPLLEKAKKTQYTFNVSLITNILWRSQVNGSLCLRHRAEPYPFHLSPLLILMKEVSICAGYPGRGEVSSQRGPSPVSFSSVECFLPQTFSPSASSQPSCQSLFNAPLGCYHDFSSDRPEWGRVAVPRRRWTTFPFLSLQCCWQQFYHILATRSLMLVILFLFRPPRRLPSREFREDLAHSANH